MRDSLRIAAGLAGDLAVAALAVVAVVASFGGGDDSAYLFPRLTSAAWLGLCVLYLVLRAAGAARPENPDFAALRRAAPGAAVVAAYAALAEAAGFYFSALCAFLALTTIYDRRGGRGGRGGWRRAMARFAVACVIILVLRAVFSEILRVQTPRGALF